VRTAPLGVIVPAYNERESITDTIRSLQAQTIQPAEIVVDDCSTDGTGALARSLGSIPLRPVTELRADLHTHDSQLASEAAPGASWRYASAALSLRFASR
jgi:GT2 family glycosyltransferase